MSNQVHYDKSILNCPSCQLGLRVPHNKGDLEIRCPNCGHVEEWEEDLIKIKGKNDLGYEALKKIIDKKISEVKGYIPRVGIFGVTGVGKSSLCNALFGHDVAEISDVAACTRNPQEIHLSTLNESSGIVLIDVPGVGETAERDVEYFKLYESLAPTLDVVIWVIKADDRAYAVAQKAYQEILKPNLDNCPVIFVVNQVDKLPPLRDWDENKNRPGEAKGANIQKKIMEVSSAFEVPVNKIVPVSVEEKYNLTAIISLVVDILPNNKKYAFAREAQESVKNEEIKFKAEKGVWDYIKEFAGDAWEKVKEPVISVLKTAATVGVNRLINAFLKK